MIVFKCAHCGHVLRKGEPVSAREVADAFGNMCPKCFSYLRGDSTEWRISAEEGRRSRCAQAAEEKAAEPVATESIARREAGAEAGTGEAEATPEAEPGKGLEPLPQPLLQQLLQPRAWWTRARPKEQRAREQERTKPRAQPIAPRQARPRKERIT